MKKKDEQADQVENKTGEAGNAPLEDQDQPTGTADEKTGEGQTQEAIPEAKEKTAEKANTADTPEKGKQKAQKENPLYPIARELFKSHKVDEVHFTHDKTPFFEKQHAVLHAHALSDHSIVTITRQEVK